MAGITHSAFRRLVSDFGGHGALFTEMLSARSVLFENAATSPHLRRRPQEGAVVYQLLCNEEDDIPAVIDRLVPLKPAGIDLNLGCPAPEVLRRRGGAAVFRDAGRLEKTLRCVRGAWPGFLSVKCRLGDEGADWREQFARRLAIIEECGADALFLHPRYIHEKLRRRARWELLPWVCGQTRLPVVATGDIRCAADIEGHAGDFAPTAGIMLGRIAIAQPWVFAGFAGRTVSFDAARTWERFYGYLNEDFPPERVLGRLRDFTAYYSRNFFFGHDLYRALYGAQTPAEAFGRAMEFLSKSPRMVSEPSVDGI